VDLMAGRNGRNGRRGKDMPLVDLRKQLVGETSHSVAGVAWRWRNEVTGALVALMLFGHLVDRVGRAWAWGVVALVLVIVVAVPWLRRFAVGRAWCVITRHRLFAVFGESRVFNRSGRFPLILRIARTPGRREGLGVVPARYLR
jgi:hypothetical protein